MRDKRQRILSNPAAYRQQQIDARVPDDFDDLPEEEQQEIMAALEDAVISVGRVPKNLWTTGDQRMGRIHRYLQEKDCLILNFVSTNTREGPPRPAGGADPRRY